MIMPLAVVYVKRKKFVSKIPFIYAGTKGTMGWDVSDLTGPDEEDWRVPVSELEIANLGFPVG